MNTDDMAEMLDDLQEALDLIGGKGPASVTIADLQRAAHLIRKVKFLMSAEFYAR